MIKKLYDKCVAWAGHRYAKPLLAFESFIESSFFPIPPDVMIIPMVVSKKREFFGCLRRNNFVTVLYKQTSDKIPGDFLGRLVFLIVILVRYSCLCFFWGAFISASRFF